MGAAGGAIAGALWSSRQFAILFIDTTLVDGTEIEMYSTSPVGVHCEMGSHRRFLSVPDKPSQNTKYDNIKKVAVQGPKIGWYLLEVNPGWLFRSPRITKVYESPIKNYNCSSD
jgi:hypothetical protein